MFLSKLTKLIRPISIASQSFRAPMLKVPQFHFKSDYLKLMSQRKGSINRSVEDC